MRVLGSLTTPLVASLPASGEAGQIVMVDGDGPYIHDGAGWNPYEGPEGSRIHSGTATPVAIGVAGDYYLRTDGQLYGPRLADDLAAGWSRPDNFDGADGISKWVVHFGTIELSAEQARSAPYSMKLIAAGGASQAFARPHADHLQPVVEGDSVILSMWVYCPEARSVAASIDWRNSSKSWLSTSSVTKSVAAGEWTYLEVTATAPVNTAYVGWGPTMPGTPAAGAVLYADDVMMTAAVVRTNRWPTPISLIGPTGPTGPTGPQGEQGPAGPEGSGDPGSVIHDGTGAPTADIGVLGDYYLDTATADLYGPKELVGSKSGVGSIGTGLRIQASTWRAKMLSSAGFSFSRVGMLIGVYGGTVTSAFTADSEVRFQVLSADKATVLSDTGWLNVGGVTAEAYFSADLPSEVTIPAGGEFWFQIEGRVASTQAVMALNFYANTGSNLAHGSVSQPSGTVLETQSSSYTAYYGTFYLEGGFTPTWPSPPLGLRGPTVPLNQLPTPTANSSIGGYKLTSLGTPTVAADAATKGYVDSLVELLHDTNMAGISAVSYSPSQAYNDLLIVVSELRDDTAGRLMMLVNSVFGSYISFSNDVKTYNSAAAEIIGFVLDNPTSAHIHIPNYSTATYGSRNVYYTGAEGSINYALPVYGAARFATTAAVTSVLFQHSGSQGFTAGRIRVYGIKG